MTRWHGLYALALATALFGGCNGTGQPNDDETATNVDIGSEFVSAYRTGSTTGQQEVVICNGWFPNTPNHILSIDDALSMTVSATSAGDERLWILFQNSNFCGEGTDAQAVMRFWGTGTVEVYVGTATQGASLDYELDFTARAVTASAMRSPTSTVPAAR